MYVYCICVCASVFSGTFSGSVLITGVRPSEPVCWIKINCQRIKMFPRFQEEIRARQLRRRCERGVCSIFTCSHYYSYPSLGSPVWNTGWEQQPPPPPHPSSMSQPCVCHTHTHTCLCCCVGTLKHYNPPLPPPPPLSPFFHVSSQSEPDPARHMGNQPLCFHLAQ